MPATERYQVDFFAILVLIASVLILVFLIIAAIYFYNLINFKPPTSGESTFLLWTSIILGIIFLALSIYALIRIFTHTSTVYEEGGHYPIQVMPAPVPTFMPAPVPYVTPTPVMVAPVPQLRAPIPQTRTPIQQTTPTVRISNIPQTSRQTNVSQSFSDVPVTQAQRSALNQELISLGDAV